MRRTEHVRAASLSMTSAEGSDSERLTQAE